MRPGEIATRARLELRRLVSPYPRLFVPLMRLRSTHDGHVIDGDTEIMIEGAPRSGNTFAVAAFEHAQGRPVAMARHLHGAGHVLEGIRRGVPVLVVCRDPRDSVTSQVIRHPETTLAQALRQWIAFHEPLVEHREQMVIGRFEQVISDFGSVIGRINEKYGTRFESFEHTPQNVDAVFAKVDMMDREDMGRRANDSMATTARPTEAREAEKARIQEGLDSRSVRRSLDNALGLHETFVPKIADREV